MNKSNMAIESAITTLLSTTNMNAIYSQYYLHTYKHGSLEKESDVAWNLVELIRTIVDHDAESGPDPRTMRSPGDEHHYY